MQKILVSACLAGERVRFDAGDVACADDRFAAWRHEGRLVAICPEVEGGLSVPRPRARRVAGRVIADDGSAAGQDVTAAYVAGAEAALALARQHDIRLAILKQSSPSCGSSSIFTPDMADKIPGQGTTTELLRAHGITVFGEDELEAAALWLRTHDDAPARR